MHLAEFIIKRNSQCNYACRGIEAQVTVRE